MRNPTQLFEIEELIYDLITTNSALKKILMKKFTIYYRYGNAKIAELLFNIEQSKEKEATYSPETIQQIYLQNCEFLDAVEDASENHLNQVKNIIENYYPDN